MKKVNHAPQEAYQELLTVAKWTIQMLKQNAIAYGGNTINPHGYDEFCNWAAAVKAAVAKAEIVQDSPQQIKKTHADVRLPEFKENKVVKQPCFVE